MAIQINDFSIIDNGETMSIDIETSIGETITSVKLWKMDDFKNYASAINLDYKLVQSDNTETFNVTALELSLSTFEDIYFIEIEDSDDTTTIGITYNLLQYYACMLNYLQESEITDCDNCNNLTNKNIVVTISLLIDSIKNAISLGFYTHAVNNVNKLKKICGLKQCTNCNVITCNTCSQFNQLN